MKERILGSIGVLWGVAILIYGLVGNHHDRFRQTARTKPEKLLRLSSECSS
jgi:hypothetical protein